MRGLRAPHSVGVRPGATQPCTDSTDVTVCSPGISLLHDVNQTAGFGPAEPISLRGLDLRCLLRARAFAVWWSQTGSNRRPPACKAGALPTELWPRLDLATQADRHLPGVDLRAELEAPATKGMVGLERFELSTSRLSSARSNQLSYRPGKRGRCPNEERETKAAVSRMHSKNRSDS